MEMGSSMNSPPAEVDSRFEPKYALRIGLGVDPDVLEFRLPLELKKEQIELSLVTTTITNKNNDESKIRSLRMKLLGLHPRSDNEEEEVVEKEFRIPTGGRYDEHEEIEARFQRRSSILCVTLPKRMT
ncbi:unnamed protein product [Cuscuta epithymum]|uniref:SHSP domain-containing protein n=1 Tax=Cuscuta epithymum TaxID=186058 RepID=A0AAV0GF09_9ASTE|nr:unnamed protein product [Cuscuta epithymum]CAH9146317.1 unnamed protein product [Cuscuta epithymum]